MMNGAAVPECEKVTELPRSSDALRIAHLSFQRDGGRNDNGVTLTLTMIILRLKPVFILTTSKPQKRPIAHQYH